MSINRAVLNLKSGSATIQQPAADLGIYLLLLGNLLLTQFLNLVNLSFACLLPSNATHDWAGKTIALGTFPSAEADEKCARAKALTRAWRSTMRPKPSREWVMLELERLQVRIVSGRLGRKGDGDDDDSSDGSGSVGNGGDGGNMNNMGGMGMMGNMGGMGNMGDNNNHRPFVGGGPAAAFEAARADHYNNKGNNNNGMGGSMNNMGNNMGGGGNPNLSNLGLSVNPNQHYEMLKLHHMNLLNEIQETTLMMNLYQQQMLQQSGGIANNMGGGGGSNMGNNMGGGGNNMGMSNQGMNGQGMDMNNMGMSNSNQGTNQGGNFDGQENSGKSDDERARMLRELKEDIARQEREASELEASLDPSKRKTDDDSQGDSKRVKRDDDSGIQNETSV
ncbi:hypothetical protein ACHAXN_004886 [Cyclotella atomus]